MELKVFLITRDFFSHSNLHLGQSQKASLFAAAGTKGLSFPTQLLSYWKDTEISS